MNSLLMGARVLIVSDASCIEKLNELFSQIGVITPISTTSGNAARRTLEQCDFDIIVINAPLPDEFGHEIAMFFAEKTDAGVLLLVNNTQLEAVSEKVETYGVFVLARPLLPASFYHACRFALATRLRLNLVKKENVRLRHVMEEMRLVSRAKAALIQYENYSEAEAHRMIEKQAMDRRVSKAVIANEIISTYEV